MKNDRRVHQPFVVSALAMALTAGFGYAAILIATRALKMPIGAWWIALAQAHGHAQLFGWAGLFILGIGLFFLPRLRGKTLARVELAMPALACLVVGIILRAISQPFASLAPDFAALGRAGTIVASILELIGIALILAMLIATFRRAPRLGLDAPIIPVYSYLVIAFASLVLATICNLALAFSADAIFRADWNNAINHLLIYGFIIPIAFAMSVRTLPLFMRLATPPKRLHNSLALVCGIGVALRSVGYLEQMFFLQIGAMLEASAILIFIWKLDLARRKRPWTDARITPPPDYIETRAPTRRDYPDHGEYGRFELLILAAFAWLAFASVIAILDAASNVLGNSALFAPEIERHAITVGFITLLIFGMSARMLPGFSGKKHVASTRLVIATFILGNLAAITRVAPLFAPDFPGADIALASSGAIGWLAVACLAWNLKRTV